MKPVEIGKLFPTRDNFGERVEMMFKDDHDSAMNELRSEIAILRHSINWFKCNGGTASRSKIIEVATDTLEG